MRDPKRIPRILGKIETIWKTNPDWRLMQLILNPMADLHRASLYNLEDDSLEAYLDSIQDRLDRMSRHQASG